MIAGMAHLARPLESICVPSAAFYFDGGLVQASCLPPSGVLRTFKITPGDFVAPPFDESHFLLAQKNGTQKRAAPTCPAGSLCFSPQTARGELAAKQRHSTKWGQSNG